MGVVCRQLADGLTKDSMRQQLADKLRHGRIKFLYDPNYVAARKKFWRRNMNWNLQRRAETQRRNRSQSCALSRRSWKLLKMSK